MTFGDCYYNLAVTHFITDTASGKGLLMTVVLLVMEQTQLSHL